MNLHADARVQRCDDALSTTIGDETVLLDVDGA